MKILIATGIYPPNIGGPATYSKLLFEELPKRGIEVKIVSFDSVRKYPKGVRHIFYFLKVLLASKDVDIIYAQDPVSVGLPSMWASNILKKRFVLKIVGDYAWEQSTQRFGISDLLDDFVKHSYSAEVERLKKIQKKVAMSADQIIVPSRYLKGIVTKWGINNEKINVIYNGFDEVLDDYDKKELRNTFEFKSPVIISAGRLVPWKGFSVLISCMPELCQKISGLKLYIAGDGPEKEKLLLQVSELNLKESVIFLGSLSKEKLFQYIVASDIFVLNTGYEGFSHQILEVLALKTPIITTNVGGNPEIIESEKDGILVTYNNSDELKNNIENLFLDEDRSKKFITNGLEKVSQFTISRMLDELEFIFKKKI